jgi:hypothetical protein
VKWRVSASFPHLAARVFPVPVFGLLLATVLCKYFVFSEAIYLHAHKREPFPSASIAVGVLMAYSTLFMGKFWGASGVTLGYFCSSGIFGLAIIGTYIFITMRRQWHKTASLEESYTL